MLTFGELLEEFDQREAAAASDSERIEIIFWALRMLLQKMRDGEKV
jgi:hypothetical protein